MRILGLALVAATCVMAGPPAASAGVNTYFASPTGTALDDCTVGDPCDLDTALSSSGSGDDVALVGGIAPASPFTSAFTLEIPDGVTLHGAPGARPTIVSNSGIYAVNVGTDLGSGAVLRDVIVESAGTTSAGIVQVLGSGTVERVTVESSGSSNACFATPGSTFRDSVCWHSGATPGVAGLHAAPQGATGTVTVSNVTAVGSIGIEAVMNIAGGVLVNALNVIASGVEDVEADVVADNQGGGGTLTVSLGHSNFNEVTDEGNASGTVTSPGTGPPSMNQTVPPVFVDRDDGDFRQAATSVSTIDLGSSAGLLPGELDFEGQQRTFGPAPDIGADEFVPAPPPSPVVGSTPPPTAIPAPRKRCKKGFRLKKIRGKRKCVRRKRK